MQITYKMIPERLGHFSIQLTLDTYSHVVPGLQAAVARKLDDILDALLPVPNI